MRRQLVDEQGKLGVQSSACPEGEPVFSRSCALRAVKSHAGSSARQHVTWALVRQLRRVIGLLLGPCPRWSWFRPPPGRVRPGARRWRFAAV